MIAVKKIILLAALAFFVRPASAAPIVSPLLIDRMEKAVLDCLDYSSGMNCDKAKGAAKNIHSVADDAYKLTGEVPELLCASSAANVLSSLAIYRASLFTGKGIEDDRSQLIKKIPEPRERCLKSKSIKK